MRAPLALVVVLLLASVFPAGAHTPEDVPQSPQDQLLVHLDTPAVLEKGATAGRVDLRWFGGDEDLLYTSLGVHYGLGHNVEAILRGSFSDRRNLDLPDGSWIRHGGSDVELAVKYRLSATGSTPMAALLGLSWANTPAQSGSGLSLLTPEDIGDTPLFLTLGLAASSEVGSGVTAYLCPRAIFIDDNTIVGIGLGARARLSDTLALVADYTPIVSGENTRDTTTGETKRRDVWGVALRFTSRDARWSVDLGYANGTGTTTGFGLTPGLGGDGAFYAALSFRR